MDLKFYKINNENNFIFFDKLEKNQFELLYLLGSDNLKIKKRNEFIIYQGSHGDRGSEIADVIFPTPTFTEQNGLYSNLEGRLQECRKASYPIGKALEDWKIFNKISNKIDGSKLFTNFLDIRKSTLSEIKDFSGIDLLPKKESIKIEKSSNNFKDEKIIIRDLDYYFSNSIARASKTMSDCRNIKANNKKNGTFN